MSTLQGGGRLVTDGLVFYMDVTNNKCYSGTGSSFLDLSNEKNNGQLVNGSSYNTEFLGNFSFDGVNDYIEVPFDDSLNPTASVSVSSVFYITGYGNFYAPIVVKRNPSNTNYEQYSLGVYSTITQQLRFYVTGPTPSLIQTLTSYDSVFNKVIYAVGTCDAVSDRMNLYVNGNLVDSKTFSQSFFTSSNSVTIGGATLSNFPGYSAGKIYQASIYNRALTAEEVISNYEVIKSRYNI
jgi:hypothetical protein